MMRVSDETGPYMLHAEDERVLIQADPKKNERGQFQLYRKARMRIRTRSGTRMAATAFR